MVARSPITAPMGKEQTLWLARRVAPHRDEILCRANGSRDVAAKAALWQEIAEEYARAYPNETRTVRQLRKKLENSLQYMRGLESRRSRLLPGQTLPEPPEFVDSLWHFLDTPLASLSLSFATPKRKRWPTSPAPPTPPLDAAVDDTSPYGDHALVLDERAPSVFGQGGFGGGGGFERRRSPQAAEQTPAIRRLLPRKREEEEEDEGSIDVSLRAPVDGGLGAQLQRARIAREEAQTTKLREETRLLRIQRRKAALELRRLEQGWT